MLIFFLEFFLYAPFEKCGNFFLENFLKTPFFILTDFFLEKILKRRTANRDPILTRK